MTDSKEATIPFASYPYVSSEVTGTFIADGEEWQEVTVKVIYADNTVIPFTYATEEYEPLSARRRASYIREAELAKKGDRSLGSIARVSKLVKDSGVGFEQAEYSYERKTFLISIVVLGELVWLTANTEKELASEIDKAKLSVIIQGMK